jgi:hypothetical protein
MIQRIQSLYLLVVVVLSAITFFNPVVSFINAEQAREYILDYKGISLVQEAGNVFQSDVWTLTVLSALIPIITLISIFLFKNRMLQLRLSFFNMVLMGGWYVLLFINIWFAKSLYQADWTLQIVAAFPLINIILTLLAVRAIGKDEALIKSLNRIR